jgi:hypothetical protein
VAFSESDQLGKNHRVPLNYQERRIKEPPSSFAGAWATFELPLVSDEVQKEIKACRAQLHATLCFWSADTAQK